MDNHLFFRDRREFREWLTQNYDKSNGIWLVYYKIPGKQILTYEESLDEALCFGWIDSLIRRIDDEKYIRKFTPRRKKSKWSEKNKESVKRLIDAGLMAEWGLRAVEDAVKTGMWDNFKHTTPSEPNITEFDKIIRGFAEYTIYVSLPPSHKKQYALFYFDARKEVTKTARLKKILELIRNRKKLM